MRVGGGVIAALAGLVSAAAVAAQSFDVATVKRTPPEATGVEQPSIVQFQPQAFRRTNSTLRTIVRTAYNVQDYQGKRSMAQLAQYLGSIVGRPVVDRTGVTGNFEMSLTFAPDLRDTERPSIFVALPEQMGVRLEPARGRSKRSRSRAPACRPRTDVALLEGEHRLRAEVHCRGRARSSVG